MVGWQRTLNTAAAGAAAEAEEEQLPDGDDWAAGGGGARRTGADRAEGVRCACELLTMSLQAWTDERAAEGERSGGRERDHERD
jgi:hypothetical protein